MNEFERNLIHELSKLVSAVDRLSCKLDTLIDSADICCNSLDEISTEIFNARMSNDKI